MPALGMAQETGKLVRWLRKEGDQVSEGDPLMEIETDKVTVEIESPAGGVLGGLRAGEGEDVPVGQIVGWILEPGESPPEISPASPEPTAAAETPKESRQARTHKAASPVAARVAAAHGVDLGALGSDGDRVRKAEVLAFIEQDEAADPSRRAELLASPKARRLAAEHQLDLGQIAGSGPEGAVLAGDVLNAALAQTTSGAIEMSPVWSRMVERLGQGWSQSPHFYLVREVNASQLLKWHQSFQAEDAPHPTITDLLLRLTAVALRRHPRLNASWQDGVIYQHPDINLGLAVAIDEGLVVPVLHRADELDVQELSAQRAALVERARSGRMKPEDVQGGTFTVSNLGMYGVDAFFAVVNPPQASILAVGRIAERVVPLAGQPAVQPMMAISLSSDHRVVDGARAAAFLDELANLIEAPIQLLR